MASEVWLVVLHVTESAEVGVVGVEDKRVFALGSEEPVVGERFLVVEVEDEE